MLEMRKFVIAALALALPAVTVAEVHHFAVDAVHSEVGFKARHLVATTPGRFDQFEGHVWLDPENIKNTLKLEATIQAASVDTNNEKRDGHLQSADFFDVENHPEVKFVSKSVKFKDGLYYVVGDITIRGVTKEVELEAEYNGITTNPFTGTPTIGMELEGKVNRKDFGMVWNKTLDAGGVVLGDEIKIVVHIEATVPPEATEAKS
jgi:polyisoprenoid-binding protein YceI